VSHLHVSRSLYQFQVHGKKIGYGQLANQNGFPRAHVSNMYQCTAVCFFAGPTMEALLHHECPGLGLIGEYLVMSNSNIYSEVHINCNFSADTLLPPFALFRRFFCRFQSVAFYSETMTSNKLTNWTGKIVMSGT